jgi:hypothetical protein
MMAPDQLETMMRYEWLMMGLRASLLAALGAGCETTEIIQRESEDAGPRFDGSSPHPDAATATPDSGATPDAATPPPDAGPTPDAGPCMNPAPVLNPDGQPSGWVRCEDGALNRVEARACDPTPPGEQCPEGNGGGGQCSADADCDAKADGRCVTMFFGGKQGGDCGCVYGCETDADCGPEQVCLCGAAPGARCVVSTCATNDDCGPGECGLGASDDGCGINYNLTCRTPDDTCRTNEDCADDWQACTSWGDNAWACQSQGACGRPLLIDGALRLAAPEGRCDWSEGLQPLAPSPAEAAALATFWSNIAALEHASVASFSKFSLQLMALGAPADLLMDTQRAAADEVVHAQLAYGLASAYAQQPIGPGPLALGDLNIETDPAAIVAALVEEACVGETLGAADAAAAAADCTDPVVAAVWRRIAEDELRHAQLGWRTLQWMLAQHPETRGVAAAAFTHANEHWMARARAARPGAAMPTVLGAMDRAQVHREALAAVIAPCALQLVA